MRTFGHCILTDREVPEIASRRVGVAAKQVAAMYENWKPMMSLARKDRAGCEGYEITNILSNGADAAYAEVSPSEQDEGLEDKNSAVGDMSLHYSTMVIRDQTQACK